MAEQVFPQNGDFNDAENFAHLFGQDNLLDYVEKGMGLTLNAGGPTLDIAAGKAYIQDDSATGAQSGLTLDEVGFVVEKDAVSGLSLTDSTTNYVWLNANVGSDNAAAYEITTTDSAPQTDSLKIGEVDTNTDTTTELNRNPSYEVENLTAQNNVTVSNNLTVSNTTTLNGNLTFTGGSIDLEGTGADTIMTLDSGFEFRIEADGGSDTHAFDESGNIDITGSLTEGASL